MILWLLLLINLTLAIVLPAGTGYAIGWKILMGFTIYFCFSVLSFFFAVGVSMLLGRKDKYVLRRKRRYFITEYNDEYVKMRDFDGHFEKFALCLMDEIHYCDVLTPYVDVEYYNHGGWRKIWLLDTYDDEVKYKCYLPDKTKS
jgi:hypothetical protein